MKIVGVTGKIGSGKSTVCNELAHRYGYKVLSVDVIRHGLMKLRTDESACRFRGKLIKAFELEPLSQFNFYDYSKFATLLFQSKDSIEKCASIMTPYIKDSLKLEIEKLSLNNCATKVALEWAYLIEHGYLDLVDSVLLVTCSEASFKEREYAMYLEDAEQTAQLRRSLEPSDDCRISQLNKLNVPYRVYSNNNYDFSDLYA